jgi:hypothetical protein
MIDKVSSLSRGGSWGGIMGKEKPILTPALSLKERAKI